MKYPSPQPLSLKGRGAKIERFLFPSPLEGEGLGVRGKAAGFTLLEVLIVLILAGFLMGVVATSLSDGPVLRKSSREVAASLRQARAQAVMRQQPTLWKMNIQEKRFWIEDGAGDGSRNLANSVMAKINTTAAEVDSAQQGGIRFYPDGSSTGGSVELAYNQQTYKINVEWVTGRVSIQ
ncbi:MAG: GspH/FimT family pseudopilin [Gammaproteobacteria bacterium]|nr:GspH/FimT family pseudopilin [Gammaproteobacteria bacterium]MBU1725286.1 GspH/FimT family pseudopilin [Gammaproteobacteria bacterium]MBU2006790.1 GspH/FimT family pseudopilin [Gammaproteobacteria bacterium]